METQANEPQPIANLLKQGLPTISPSSGSEIRVFKTPEEADAAYAAHQAFENRRQRLQESKYPSRHIETLKTMHGPSLEKAEALWPRVESNGLIFLVGERGPGKTQMATWFGWKLLENHRSCGRYVKLADLFNDLKATWNGRGDRAEVEILKPFFKAKFLVIDEAQERGTGENDRDWADRTLTNLIDHRYDAMLPTVLCANYSLDLYSAQVPAAIRSRIVETGGVVVCDWPSYRQ